MADPTEESENAAIDALIKLRNCRDENKKLIKAMAENEQLILDTIRQVGNHIGWYCPQSKRFTYKDVKDSSPHYKGYTVPVYTIPAIKP